MYRGGLRLAGIAVLAAFLLVAVTPLPAQAAPGGNSAAAKACQKGGWQTLITSTGGSFANQGDCVSYAAQGGEFGVSYHDQFEDLCSTLVSVWEEGSNYWACHTAGISGDTATAMQAICVAAGGSYSGYLDGYPGYPILSACFFP